MQPHLQALLENLRAGRNNRHLNQNLNYPATTFP